MYLAKVHVTLKKSVLDPQGKTILSALHSLNFNDATNVRVGKYFEVFVEGKDPKQVEERIHQMCDKLLINPIIEEYSYSLEEAPVAVRK
jgi:phosphoribosylformylglycinamidine synthase subunit PurS